MNAINIGSAGAINAVHRFDASAQRMTSAQGDLATETVEQISDKAAFSASLAVVQTSDDMMKRLLDIKI